MFDDACLQFVLSRACKVELNGSSSLGFACFSMLSFSLSDNQPVRDCHSFAARLVEKYYSLPVPLANSGASTHF